MKRFSLILLAALALVAVPILAQANAIYNDSDFKVCASVGTWEHLMGHCKAWVSPHSTHNGPHGSGLAQCPLHPAEP